MSLRTTSTKWVRSVIGASTMPFGMARHLARRIADLPQSVFALPSVFRRDLGGGFIGLMGVLSRGFWVRLLPKPLGNRQGIDVEALPPGHLIAGLMQLPMMTAAEGDGELVADFETCLLYT